MVESRFKVSLFSDYIQNVYLPTVDLIDNLGNTAIGWGQTNDGKFLIQDNSGFLSLGLQLLLESLTNLITSK